MYIPGVGRCCKKCGRPLDPTLGRKQFCSETCAEEQNRERNRKAYKPHPRPDLSYKVLPVGDGWLVFFYEKGKPPRPVDGRVKPYTQKTHAYRRARQLNDAIKDIDAMIARDGAIIL